MARVIVNSLPEMKYPVRGRWHYVYGSRPTLRDLAAICRILLLNGHVLIVEYHRLATLDRFDLFPRYTALKNFSCTI